MESHKSMNDWWLRYRAARCREISPLQASVCAWLMLGQLLIIVGFCVAGLWRWLA